MSMRVELANAVPRLSWMPVVKRTRFDGLGASADLSDPARRLADPTGCAILTQPFPAGPPEQLTTPANTLSGARTMRTYVISLVIALAVLLGAAPAQAQYGVRQPAATAVGERYHVELSGDFWSPSPLVAVTSESLGIPGTTFDLASDFGVTKERFRQFQLVLRPARKHKFRVEYTPIRYQTDTVLERNIVFNGIGFRVGVPVGLDFEWKAWRLGYEYDIIYRERGFLGFIVEAKYTDVNVNLTSVLAQEYARARAPIPAIGGIGRIYVARNVGLTFELSGFELPKSLDEGTTASYFEMDLYGTVNFTNNVGAQFGYRRLHINYAIDLDQGDFDLKGPYFGAVVRF